MRKSEGCSETWRLPLSARDHVDEDRFRAVNEALLPILADRIASMRSREIDDQLWQAAIGDVQTPGLG